jgi:hypothetical protein
MTIYAQFNITATTTDMKRLKEEIAASLIRKLWEAYLDRVSYARIYSEMVRKKNGNLVIDHIGFRTLNAHTGEQPEGIWAIRHIFESLGYYPAEKYRFTKKNLMATQFESEYKGFPKIFISQLEVALLPDWIQQLFPEIVSNTSYLLSDSGIELLSKIKSDGLLTAEAAEVLENELVNYFQRPWHPPLKDTILKMNDVSHYAAWVLLHGNAPSHFASLINGQNIAAWPDIESTCQALQKAGIPMKEKIEGEKGSLLQQSATYAVKEDVTVSGENGLEEIPWTYGYLEFIQRGITNDNGQDYFPNFIESQERHLYKMTMTLDN